MSSVIPSRPLSKIETSVWALDRGAPLNFTTIVKLSGPLETEALRHALAALQARHPYLRVRIALDDAWPMFHWEGVGEIGLRVVDLEG